MKKSNILSVLYLIVSTVMIFFMQEMFLTLVFNNFGQKGVGYNISVETESPTIRYQYFNKFLGKEIKIVRTLEANSLKERFLNKKNITIYYTKQYPYRQRIDLLPDFSSFISSFIGLLAGIVVFIISLKEILNPFFVKKQKEY